MDNISAQVDKQVGIVAGDVESYWTFAELFDTIIDRWHCGFPPHAKHTNDLDPYKISKTQIDPTAKYVLSSRVSIVRSIRGYRLPPSISFQERRDVERLAVQALKTFPIHLRGYYRPLVGSRSFSTENNGTDETHNKEEDITHPESGPLLSSGVGRHWPDARGVFHNDTDDLRVLVNNVEHLEFISTRKGDGVRACFAELSEALRTFEASLASQNRELMHNDRLGYLSSHLDNLGTGLHISVEMRIPNMIGRPDFERIIRRIGLKAAGNTQGDKFHHTLFVGNLDVLGRSEVEIADAVIEGCARLVEWEQALEKGRDITSELPR
ncbi:Creatine kinase B-type, putative [Perkinsus marinus ATCC 50983]|uniref:Creatine kinase B-type, putative n=1 Tax=Perkinsus marinus (strain ATCC 50983 / TXsc) TaxID=423536 RepID=C5LF99_PERM5|nr:Creatine kinase B-type, putative [Perkinsus marinus ATCC 50983]EER04614.1 Creatine kinase B-type, putative [Perkinsus marinus ATCC 50983]|eukprot:XP_002772798.1 Creatine kinase B-type, putative [Perkinsus marinus ATCC 50983]